MAHEKLLPEFTFDDYKIKQLKQIVPECFEDGKINFETLRQNLGDWAQDEDDDTLEHFGLFWPGKKEARKLAAIPSEGTLEPVYGEGLKPDGTPDADGKNDSKNIFIEGENLEVLKILQKSYANRIKMIYIDPPYNTGNDFVYDDDFTEPLQEYLRRTGQIDEEGKPLTTNKRSDGRFHSKWLSMMYPRLRLARNLLKDDGVIFVSIDDNEVHNLRAIMNEIFGEENFIAQLVWKKRKGGGNDSTFIARDHEYILAYTKNSDSNDKWRVPYEEQYLKRYREKDDLGKFYWDTLAREGLKSPIIYDVVCPDNSIIKNGKWQISEPTFKLKKETGEIKFSQNENGKWSIHYKIRQPKGRVFRSIINNVTNSDAGDEMFEMFDVKKIFDNPKPTKLLKNILLLNVESDDYILDFFSGSFSTSDAVYQLNNEFNLNLKWIGVQMPHEITKDTEAGKNALEFGFKNIIELAKQRVIRCLEKENRKNNFDNGFRFIELVDSNYKKWQDINTTNVSQVELALDEFVDSPLKPDWSKNKLIVEIQLLEGFPLDSKIETTTIGNNEVNQISHDDLETKLLVCLDKSIDTNLIEDLELDSSSIFICLDSSISNQDKLRLSDKGLIKTI